MPPSGLTPLAVALAGVLLAAALTMGRFTSSSHGSAPYGALEDLITTTLQDPEPPPLARADSLLPLVRVPPPPAESGGATAGAAPESLPEPVRWVRWAARADSGHLRAWLGPTVLATSVATGDTVHLTLRRLVLAPGCPWFSTLHATFGGNLTRTLRPVRLSANCPRGYDRAVAP